MAQQAYTATNNVSTTTTSTLTTYPVEQGGTLSWGSGVGLSGSAGGSGAQAVFNSTGINAAELNADTRLTTTGAVTADGVDFYAELQNFITLLCRVPTLGLSGVTLNGVGTAQNGVGTAHTPVFVMTPRVAMFRLQQMLTAMLSQPNV